MNTNNPDVITAATKSAEKNAVSDPHNLSPSEFELVKADLREAAADAKAGILAMGPSAGLVLAAAAVLLLCAIYLLALALPLWVSTFIAGVLAAIAGYPMLNAVRAKLEPASFELVRAFDGVRQNDTSTQSSSG